MHIGSNMNYKLLDLHIFGDERGKLISLEGNKNIPFDIKRVYWIFDTLPDQDRGMHRYGNNVVPDKLVKVIKNVLKPHTQETETLLTEPVTKDSRNVFKKIGDFFSTDGCDEDPTAYRWS